MSTPQERAMVTELTRKLTDEGKVIEAGWIGLKILSLPKDASQTQIDEMRMAFFAGAQHLFASIISILEPGAEPTDTDMKRMDQIDAELKEFLEDFKRRQSPRRN